MDPNSLNKINININKPIDNRSRPSVQITNSTSKQRSSLLYFIIPVTLIICTAIFAYFYFNSKGGEENTSENIEKLLKQVGELIILPAGENPTVATVSDPEKIKNQPFFANAKEGDKVLIYLQARKAYLYRPSDEKLVEVAPLSAENASSISNVATTTRK